MKKYSFTLLLMSLLLASCGGETPSSVVPSSTSPSSELPSSEVISSEPSSESIAPSSEASSQAPISSELPPSSESSSAPSSEEPAPTEQVTVKIATVTIDKFDVTLDYSDEYFDQASNVFNKDLMMISFGLNSSSDSKDEIEKNFNSIGLTNHLFVGYDEEFTKDSFGYGIGSKELKDNRLLVFFSPRGFQYHSEWANNFTIGKEGNHEGFNECANKALESLKTYLSDYPEKEIVLWFTGFSRGGGIANLLSNFVLNDNELNIDEAHLYTYTFEAPAGLAVENYQGYDSVFNIITGGDFVPLIPPYEYGLVREGNDVIIDTSKLDVDEIVKEFSDKINLPAFVTSSESDPQNEIEFANWIVSQLLVEYEEEDKGINTRTKYVNNAQGPATYLLDLFFRLKSSTLTAILDYVKAQTKESPLEFVFTILTEDGLFNALNPFIKEDGVVYDEEDLRSNCNAGVKVISEVGAAPALKLYANGTYTNALRMFYFHFPEVIYNIYLNFDIN